MTTTSESNPGVMPTTAEDVPGGAKTLTSKVVGAAAGMVQDLTPVKQFQEHVCTWAIFSHDMSRKIETHHHVARLNEDFCQCAVYDSDESNARLIGVEYVISEKLFESLPDEEKQLWHSHFYEIKEGLWFNPGVPELVQQQELKSLAKTYGKFWCTWQFDRGDRLPLGPPALMMSPQQVEPGRIPDEMVKTRDAKYDISTSNRAVKRETSIEGPASFHPLSDRWMTTGKGWAVDLKEVPIALGGSTPLATLDAAQPHP
ncbi:hypothetical protein M758_10G121600 [Ceratodon purpureus]|uniref:Oil body-associated protein 2B n=1 Tax=Ceratodon purpureus TaxID=3225 RepID=A0A8T0GPW5_CERPU|nr:hypothetical protein KC19_10G126400 [Ceratodon purpureus]KAG0559747.1 hypothetical protein KC19_10G126400 [Ceratodon purpureus]KAG0559748.1 hypothetical protein KC19_10G126400 [Ceratodon purpureus]KAG0603802.1 hypothetical protein M758_10G121600 [Ceratodon purpureus]KAG0603803.1 hypothetical protein M758_10G121600 [Ceratodon purpureus]